MNLSHYAPRAGRYQGIGEGRFLVRCLDCDMVVEAFWGRSGPARAPAILRSMFWSLIGQRSKARWRCGQCTASAAATRRAETEGLGPKAGRAASEAGDAQNAVPVPMKREGVCDE